MSEIYIRSKLDSLELTRRGLHEAADELIDEAIKEGAAWLEKEDDRTHTLKETGQLLDNVGLYLNIKLDEFTSIKNKIADGTIDVNSDEQEMSESFQATMQSLSDTRDGGSAVDLRVIRQLQARVGVLEEAVWSLKAIAGEQGSTGTEYQEMISTHSQKLVQFDARLDQLEERAYDLNNSVEELEKNEKEHVKKLETVKQEIEMANECMDDSAKKTESLNTAVKKVDQECSESRQASRALESRLTTVEEHGQQEMEKVKTYIEKLKTNHSALCQMMDSKLKPLIQLMKILNKKIKEKDEQTQKVLRLLKLVELLQVWKELNTDSRMTIMNLLEKLPHDDSMSLIRALEKLDANRCNSLMSCMGKLSVTDGTRLLNLLEKLDANMCNDFIGKLSVADGTRLLNFLEKLDANRCTSLVNYVNNFDVTHGEKLLNLLNSITRQIQTNNLVNKTFYFDTFSLQSCYIIFRVIALRSFKQSHISFFLVLIVCLEKLEDQLGLDDCRTSLDVVDRLLKLRRFSRSVLNSLIDLPIDEFNRKIQGWSGLSGEVLCDTAWAWKPSKKKP